MHDLPTFSDAADAAQDAVRHHGRALIPWLPTPPTCEECGALMYASVSFDSHFVEYVNSWECRECDAPDIYRNDPDVPDPEPPREGASFVNDNIKRWTNE